MEELKEYELGTTIEEKDNMDDLSYFFPEVAEAKEEFIELVASPRFKNREGKVVLWKFRVLSADEINDIKKRSTKMEKRNGQRVVTSDPSLVAQSCILDSIVYPNLKSANLQDKHGVKSEKSLLKAMLTGPELERLGDKILREQGFLDDINTVIETAKN